MTDDKVEQSVTQEVYSIEIVLSRGKGQNLTKDLAKHHMLQRCNTLSSIIDMGLKAPTKFTVAAQYLDDIRIKIKVKGSKQLLTLLRTTLTVVAQI